MLETDCCLHAIMSLSINFPIYHFAFNDNSCDVVSILVLIKNYDDIVIFV